MFRLRASFNIGTPRQQFVYFASFITVIELDGSDCSLKKGF